MNTNPYAVFVSSSDNYSDIWNLFFDMFARFWPEYKGTIYLQTQEKEYHHSQLNIICTKVGKRKHFGETLRAGLDKVKEENILLFMIDYMIMAKVDDEKMQRYYGFFSSNDCDTLRLREERFLHYEDTTDSEIKRCLPPAEHRFFSYQLAFWRKSKLVPMAYPHETPWSSEYYGDKRAHAIPLKLYSIKQDITPPIRYDSRGCLHRGKWLDNAVTFLKEMNYEIDFNKRGYYDDDYKKDRWKVSWMIKRDGLKGSYLDMLLRKVGIRK